jgi:hypothetical protein
MRFRGGRDVVLLGLYHLERVSWTRITQAAPLPI